MAEDRMRILEERLTRLEANLQRAASGAGAGFGGGFTAVPSPVVDPAPWPYHWYRRPNFIADPAPYPHPVVDPAPWPNPIADPATIAQSSLTAAGLGRRIMTGVDPPPPDITRYSVIQLEAALHSIAAERARLDSMEQMINKQLETARKQQG